VKVWVSTHALQRARAYAGIAPQVTDRGLRNLLGRACATAHHQAVALPTPSYPQQRLAAITINGAKLYAVLRPDQDGLGPALWVCPTVLNEDAVQVPSKGLGTLGDLLKDKEET
jgi:hypothetical protein